MRATGQRRPALVVLIGLALAACRGDEPAPAVATPAPDLGARLGVAAESNVRAADYVGPAACGECHPDKLASWRRGSHAAMNQLASPTSVLAPIGQARAYAGGEVGLERVGDHLVVRLRRGAVDRRFVLTRTIGWRYLQEYVGRELPAGATDPARATGDEVRLPFGYWPRAGGWLPQPYFDSWFGREFDERGQLAFDPYQAPTSPWAARCPWCHNTYPFELRLARTSAAGAIIGRGPEVDVVDLAPTTLTQTTQGDHVLPTERLVTVGISCESCHLGGRHHAETEQPPSFVPRGPALAQRPGSSADLQPDGHGGRTRPGVLMATCAGCHSTPSPTYPDGAAARNSSEALAMQAGACASAISCTTCHDPHQRGPDAPAPPDPRHDAACVRCHATLADPATAAAHRRHDGVDGVGCLDCHLPPIVQGVSAVVRSHRISSPADPRMLGGDVPGACNLCHLDRSLRWTLEELRAGWDADVAAAWPTDPGERAALDEPVGERWLRSRHAMTRLVAAAAWARQHPGPATARRLLDVLDDPVANTRVWIWFAIGDAVPGATGYQPAAAPAERAAQLAALRRKWAP